ncbi:MAG: hypothetical protein HDQ88_03490 [Clostridia bacterium]|nr:hypothetical protein [Clostridia bacterium]
MNSDGSWTEGAHGWRTLCRCHACRLGETREVKGAHGQTHLCAFEVTLPASVEPLPVGTPVRIFDSRGLNLFDRSPRTDAPPQASASYPVRGFYKSGARYEYAKLWL